MSRIHFILPLAVLLGVVSPAQAATRTIQFLGSSGGNPPHFNVINMDLTSDCKVLIANTGNTNQTVLSVSMTNYDPVGGVATLGAPMDSFHVDSGGTITDCLTQNGTNNVILPGGFCMFRSKIYNIGYDGQWTVCAGQIQVQDTTPATPGSVVASGAINSVQEAQVMGGTLSGVYYSSESHLTDSTNIYTNYPAPGYDPALTTSYWFHNVNFLCEAACLQINSGGTAAESTWCRDNCGQWNPRDPVNLTPNVMGFTEPDVTNFSTTNGDQPLLPNYLMPQYNAPLWSGAYLGCNGGAVDGAIGATAPTPSGLSNPQAQNLGLNTNTQPTTMFYRTANDHYAGGLVFEMNFGAMNSICSGNIPYWNQGGLDFQHDDGGDPVITVWDPTTKPNAPPERLFCAHRHGMPDLYMAVTAAANFTINAGNPF